MAKNNNKKTGNRQGQNTHRLTVKFEIAVYIVLQSIVSLFKSILFTMVPAADQRAHGRFSNIVHTVLAIVTLEGPRLMLISRYRAARMKRETKVGLSAVSGTAVAAIVIATIIVSSQLMAVTIDGRIVGYVENEEQYASLIQRAKSKLSEQVGTDNSEILIRETRVSLEPVIAPQQQAMTIVDELVSPENKGDTVEGSAQTADSNANTGQGLGTEELNDTSAKEEALVDTLIDSLIDDGSSIRATVYNIIVDNQVVVTLGSLQEASEVLQKVQDEYIPVESDFSGKFLEDVKIKGVETGLGNVNVEKPQSAVEFLLAGYAEDRAYTAVQNDNIENICKILGVTEEEIAELYADYDFDNINEGDVFKSTITRPYLSYETITTEVSVEEIPFDTIEENTNTLFLGQRQVKEEGIPGEREVTRTMTRVNGEIASATEINSVSLKEPVSEIMYVGTMMVGDDAFVGSSDGYGGGGNGPLGRPLNSWYLSRSIIPGVHTGADMIAPRGTPIFAAEYGTVSFAGVYGGYGNLLIVDHGNGLQTYYAHCDTLNVDAGAVVHRGQQIATVGSTGRSTAFHLHFEVRVGGVVQEPLNWIS